MAKQNFIAKALCSLEGHATSKVLESGKLIDIFNALK